MESGTAPLLNPPSYAQIVEAQVPAALAIPVIRGVLPVSRNLNRRVNSLCFLIGLGTGVITSLAAYVIYSSVKYYSGSSSQSDTEQKLSSRQEPAVDASIAAIEYSSSEDLVNCPDNYSLLGTLNLLPMSQWQQCNDVFAKEVTGLNPNLQDDSNRLQPYIRVITSLCLDAASQAECIVSWSRRLIEIPLQELTVFASQLDAFATQGSAAASESNPETGSEFLIADGAVCQKAPSGAPTNQ